MVVSSVHFLSGVTLVLALSAPLTAQDAPSSSLLTFRNPRTVAIERYEALSTLRKTDREAELENTDPRMKEDLWSIHLERYLVRHPELTDRQRGVILEGLALVQSGAMELAPWDLAWAEAVDRPVHQIEAHAKGVFTAAESRAIFSELGGHAAPDIGPSYGAPRGAGLRSDVYEDCDCATLDSWCDWITNPTPNCTRVRCVGSHGCGTFLLYDCNGICGQ
jgi:hypothetical protein